MGKGKKKHSKKDEVAEDILDIAAISVKKFRKVTRQIAKLSTGQKIVGGIALVAAGITYLAKQDLHLGKPSEEAANSAETPRLALPSADSPSPDEAAAQITKPAARKSRKPAKTKHDV